ncbi:MAG: TAT-variant-translocated molybdopterin oxidoreductase, partial [Saprospiraceae bacterium]
MKNQNNDIWIGMDDQSNDPDFIKSVNEEFTELPVIDALSDEETANAGSSRRDFLKYLGFGVGAATLAASCEVPIRRAIPYVVKPDSIVPGVASYFASSFVNGGDYCAVLVKTREGRPIKIEGNTLSEVTKGGTSARAQASVLSLYDVNRFKNPVSRKLEEDQSADKKAFTWEQLDKEVMAKLTAGSSIRIVTGTVLSPTTKKVIAEFTAKYPNTKHVSFDPVSSTAMLQANEQCFGERVIPNYQFQDANVIVSFGADFLGTWISPVEYASKYAKNRAIKDVNNARMSQHIQVESGMTMTGSNADNRILIRPSEQGAAIATLLNALGGSVSAPNLNAKAKAAIKKVAQKLQANKGKSLVISASNNVGEQILVNRINDLLGNYGTTIDFSEASLQRQGDDGAMNRLVSEMNSGSVDALFVMGANPVFEYPDTEKITNAINKVALKVSLGYTKDETAALCDYIAPNHHYLEAWGDAEPKRGHYSLIQPTIAPIFNTRQGEESLLKWSANPNYKSAAEQPYYEYLKSNWQENMFPAQSEFTTSFQAFWDNSLHNGVFMVRQSARPVTFAGDVSAAAAKITKAGGAEVEISFYEPLSIGNGQYSNNPWLQELPDPVTRTVWGNYLSVPTNYNGNHDFTSFRGVGQKNKKSSADLLDVTVNGAKVQCVAIPQFGQAENTVSIGLGYGRAVVGLSGKDIGQNINAWIKLDADGNRQYYASNAEVSEIVGYEHEYACVQYHHTMGVTQGVDETTGKPFNVDEASLGNKGFQGSLVNRTIIRNANLKNVVQFVDDLKHEREHHQGLNSKTLYPGYDDMYKSGHHWGMHIDLNTCIGCSACAVACMAENNVPVVGKLEVHRHHEMTWLRIDRYFYGDVENPNTVYQPMMCQHCDNAPCENVCPVAATNHSSEGLNQMTYNRCIGTRYCANNCPYKVRRFNWLDYTTADLFPANEATINGEEVPYGADNLTRMVLNPDVTVRSRGVIEKCSFCVQRIQEGKLTAKREGRRLSTNDVKTACQTACPTEALLFVDINDKKSDV